MLFQQKSNITPHSTPVPGQESATIKTIVPIKDSAAAPSAHVPKISIKDALVEILKLNHELQARKKDAVKTTEIEAYSLRVWKAHVAGDKRIRQLKGSSTFHLPPLTLTLYHDASSRRDQDD